MEDACNGWLKQKESYSFQSPLSSTFYEEVKWNEVAMKSYVNATVLPRRVTEQHTHFSSRFFGPHVLDSLEKRLSREDWAKNSMIL